MRKWIWGVFFVVAPSVAMAANQAGDIKKEREARFNEFFKALDTDHSGTLSKQEAALKAPDLAESFDAIDANHDGVLTKNEIKAAIATANKRRQAFTQNLEKADKDHNGQLSREEAQRLPNLSANFDAIDSNHDGQLVIKEIADFIRAKGNTAAASSSAPAAAQ